MSDPIPAGADPVWQPVYFEALYAACLPGEEAKLRELLVRKHWCVVIGKPVAHG